MKAIFLLSSLLFIFMLNSVFSKSNEPVTYESIDVVSKINESIEYPELAKEQWMSGFVLVDLLITNEGDIYVNEVNSNDKIFRDYVIDRLSTIKIDKNNMKEQKLICRFEFKLN